MNIGLINNRHDIPEVYDYIFKKIEDVTNLQEMYAIAYNKLKDCTEKVNLYVTGLTVATTTVIKVCIDNNIELSLWHYDKEAQKYFEQLIIELHKCSFCGQKYPVHNWTCPHCGAN